MSLPLKYVGSNNLAPGQLGKHVPANRQSTELRNAYTALVSNQSRRNADKYRDLSWKGDYDNLENDVDRAETVDLEAKEGCKALVCGARDCFELSKPLQNVAESDGMKEARLEYSKPNTSRSQKELALRKYKAEFAIELHRLAKKAVDPSTAAGKVIIERLKTNADAAKGKTNAGRKKKRRDDAREAHAAAASKKAKLKAEVDMSDAKQVAELKAAETAEQEAYNKTSAATQKKRRDDKREAHAAAAERTRKLEAEVDMSDAKQVAVLEAARMKEQEAYNKTSAGRQKTKYDDAKEAHEAAAERTRKLEATVDMSDAKQVAVLEAARMKEREAYSKTGAAKSQKSRAGKKRIKQEGLEYVRQIASEMTFTIVTAASATKAVIERRDAGIEEYRHYSV